MKTSAAVAMAPMKLPAKAMIQLASTAPVVTLPLAHAITSMLLPVNNSAPPIITMIRPAQNTIPVSKPHDAIWQAHRYRCRAPRRVVANTAPNEMKAPPNRLSTEHRERVQRRARDAARLGPQRHGGRQNGVETDGLWRLYLRPFIARPIRPPSINQSDDLHRDDLHDGHRREDHGIADVRPLGRRHSRRIDQDGRIAGRAGRDAHAGRRTESS